MIVFELTESDKTAAINAAITSGYAGKFLMLIYNKILPHLKDGEMIDPNMVYIDKNLYDWIFEAPTKYGLIIDQESWSFFMVNKGPMSIDKIPENKIYWFDNFEEVKQFKEQEAV